MAHLAQQFALHRQQRLRHVAMFGCKCAALQLGLVGHRCVRYSSAGLEDPDGHITATAYSFYWPQDPSVTPDVLSILGDSPTGIWIRNLATPEAVFGTPWDPELDTGVYHAAVHNPEITLEGLALADGRKLMNILLGANMNDTTRIYTADAMANLDDYHTTRFFGDAGQTELHSANFLLFKIKRVLLTGAVIYDLVLQKRFDAAQRLFGIVMAYVHSSGQVVTFQDLTQPMHAEWYQRLHLEPEVVVQHVLTYLVEGPPAQEEEVMDEEEWGAEEEEEEEEGEEPWEGEVQQQQQQPQPQPQQAQPQPEPLAMHQLLQALDLEAAAMVQQQQTPEVQQAAYLAAALAGFHI